MVKKEGAANTHRDFRVRRGVVLHALQWLLAKNKYYLNVRINLDALTLLPEDGNLTGLHSVTLDSTIDDPESLSAQDEDHYDAHFSGSFVPSTTQGMTNCIGVFRDNMVIIHQYYHCSSITSTEMQCVYRHVRSGSPPPMPCIRLVIPCFSTN